MNNNKDCNLVSQALVLGRSTDARQNLVYAGDKRIDLVYALLLQ